jgi:hypothetical protein
VKIHSPGSESENKDGESETGVKRLRKSINTRLSKIKRGEGNRQTHIKAIKQDLKFLNRLSHADALEMTTKISQSL